MNEPIHRRHRDAIPRQTPKEAFVGDLMFRDTAFVYRGTVTRIALGEKLMVWDSTPQPMSCSFQDHALNSEHVDPNDKGSHYARVFTRFRNFVRWHDQIIVRGKKMLVEMILDRFDNQTGDYQHTELRCVYLDQPGSINKTP